MKKLIQTIIIICFTLSCSKDDISLIPADLDKSTAMNVFCQSFTDDTLRRIEYGYDNDNLITETSIYGGVIQSKKTFTYNSNNQLVLEIYETDRRKTEKTFVYNESNQLNNIIYKRNDYDSNGQVINENQDEAPREYENNLLVKEWEYWGGFNTYEYNNGKVVKKIDNTKNAEKHHITTYKYSGDLLIQEKKETITGNVLYIKFYSYNGQNRLTTIKDGENAIEENEYIDNRLVKKKTYYFGIDPCYDVCCGNYIYRYEY